MGFHGHKVARAHKCACTRACSGEGVRSGRHAHTDAQTHNPHACTRACIRGPEGLKLGKQNPLTPDPQNTPKYIIQKRFGMRQGFKMIVEGVA